MTGLTAAERRSRPAPDRLRRPGLILTVLVGAQLTIWIDNTILTVALKTLADPFIGLGASPEALAWSLNSYTLSFGACLLAGGALGDRLGRRSGLVAGMLVFGLASAWAAWSTSTGGLIAARAVMGVGSALVVPATLALIRSLFDGAARTRAVALWSAASGLAIAIGPLLGGFLLEHFWWGSVFLVNVPVVIVSVVGALLVVPEVRPAEHANFDLVGVLLSATGLGVLVYGIIEGGRRGDWLEAQVWGAVLGGLLVLAGFVVFELRTSTPSFDVLLFVDRAFASASIGVALTFFGLVGSMYYSVFYLQGVRSLSPLECGVVLTPVAVGVLAGAPLGIRLARSVGPRAAAAPALVVVSFSLLGYAVLEQETPLWQYGVLLLVQGLAMGVAIAPLTDAVVTVLPAARAAAGAAATSVLRQVGAVLGVAVLGSLLVSGYRRGVAGLADSQPPALGGAIRESAEAGRAAAAAADTPDLVPPIDVAFLDAMHTTTVVAAVVALLGAVAVAVAMPRRARWTELVNGRQQ